MVIFSRSYCTCTHPQRASTVPSSIHGTLTHTCIRNFMKWILFLNSFLFNFSRANNWQPVLTLSVTQMVKDGRSGELTFNSYFHSNHIKEENIKVSHFRQNQSRINSRRRTRKITETWLSSTWFGGRCKVTYFWAYERRTVFDVKANERDNALLCARRSKIRTLKIIFCGVVDATSTLPIKKQEKKTIKVAC